MRNKKWTYQEVCFLKEHYGEKPASWIAKKLNRSLSSVINKKDKLKLGKFLDYADEYVTLNSLIQLCGLDASYMNKILKANFPIKRIKRINDYVKVVYLNEFFKWIEKDNNKQLIDFSKSEKGDFGAIEPDWFEEKRRADRIYNTYKQTPWTEEEDKRLIELCKQYKYSYTDISKMLLRLETAIKRRFTVLKVPYRPIRADNHNMWKPEEIELVRTLYKKGYKSIVIRNYLKNRSQLAIDGLLERHNYFLGKAA